MLMSHVLMTVTDSQDGEQNRVPTFRPEAVIDLWSLVFQWLAASRPWSVAVYNDDVAVLFTSNAGSGFAENISSLQLNVFGRQLRETRSCKSKQDY